jgi:hypothetical protein
MSNTPSSSIPSKQEEFLNAVELGSLKQQENSTSTLTLPKEQKVARAIITQIHDIQRNLFSDNEQRQNSEGNIIYSNIPTLVSDYDFRACMLATQLTLYDQSYLCHNEDINSGFAREENKELQKELQQTYHNGNICVTLADLCRVGYGIPEGQYPTPLQKSKMQRTLEALDKNPVGVKYENGDERQTYLLKIMSKYTRKKDGAVTYHLVMNPIFTTNAKGYGTILRGATTRLSLYLSSKGKTGRAGKSAAHYAFLQLLSIQDKSKEWSISIENLLIRLNLLKPFKKDKKRVTEKLKELFEAFVEIGLLLETPNPTLPDSGVYHFKINPNQTKLLKGDDNTPYR